MEELTCRLLPYCVADGPTNMARDEVLLRSAAEGQATFRFYGWSEPTLSLGYFQPEAGRRADPLLAALPYVRRLTGGDALVHHHELTYCLAVPAVYTGQAAGRLRMHEVIAAALEECGIRAYPFDAPPADKTGADFLCFRRFTAGDLMIGGHKVVGSAQRKQRGAVMQHGGILLAHSPFAPTIPGIRELAGTEASREALEAAVPDLIRGKLGLVLRQGTWTPEEERTAAELARARYADDDWNRKR